MLNEIQEKILSIVAGMKGTGEGAVNIRSDGQKAFPICCYTNFFSINHINNCFKMFSF